MTKVRYYANPSSLGSYFGVGFNDPQDQFLIDQGLLEQEFDDEAQKRLDLGSILEAPMLDFFEKQLGVIITDRNEELLEFYDGKIRGKTDGMTILNGKKTVVECKISNASSYKFTENMGYYLQVQSYIYGTDAEQGLLCGLYEGKPIFKIIPRDEECIQDILTMTDFIVECLLGFTDFNSEYPTHLIDKYAHKTLLEPLNDVNEIDEADFTELLSVKAEIKRLDDRKKVLETSIKEKFAEGIWSNDNFKLAISNKSRDGGVDLDALLMDYPEIDFNKYKKPASTWTEIRTTAFKKK